MIFAWKNSSYWNQCSLNNYHAYIIINLIYSNFLENIYERVESKIIDSEIILFRCACFLLSIRSCHAIAILSFYCELILFYNFTFCVFLVNRINCSLLSMLKDLVVISWRKLMVATEKLFNTLYLILWSIKITFSTWINYCSLLIVPVTFIFCV